MKTRARPIQFTKFSNESQELADSPESGKSRNSQLLASAFQGRYTESGYDPMGIMDNDGWCRLWLRSSAAKPWLRWERLPRLVQFLSRHVVQRIGGFVDSPYLV